MIKTDILSALSAAFGAVVALAIVHFSKATFFRKAPNMVEDFDKERK